MSGHYNLLQKARIVKEPVIGLNAVTEPPYYYISGTCQLLQELLCSTLGVLEYIHVMLGTVSLNRLDFTILEDDIRPVHGKTFAVAVHIRLQSYNGIRGVALVVHEGLHGEHWKVCSNHW